MLPEQPIAHSNSASSIMDEATDPPLSWLGFSPPPRLCIHARGHLPPRSDPQSSGNILLAGLLAAGNVKTDQPRKQKDSFSHTDHKEHSSQQQHRLVRLLMPARTVPVEPVDILKEGVNHSAYNGNGDKQNTR